MRLQRPLTRQGFPLGSVVTRLGLFALALLLLICHGQPAFAGDSEPSRAAPEDRLPTGRGVQLRQLSVWDQNPRAALVMSSAALLLCVVVTGLWLEHRRRRHSELAAKHHLAALAHVDRRIVLGELAASLAHQLSQPLAAILRNADAAKMLLASNPHADWRIEEIIDDIRNSDKRAGEIIRRLRSLLKQKELEREPVDLNAVARDTVDLVAPDVARKGVRLDFHASGALPMVMGDRVHLEQVLLNLVINAMDAIDGSGIDRRVVKVATAVEKDRVAVSVTDNGPGIPSSSLSEVFEPFFTTKSDGMGIGLSIARSIVEAHEGRITAENNSNGGATVRFSLPALQRPKETFRD
jgi:C4-dicarboxylate-specific signal transduction histidine kinase